MGSYTYTSAKEATIEEEKTVALITVDICFTHSKEICNIIKFDIHNFSIFLSIPLLLIFTLLATYLCFSSFTLSYLVRRKK